MNIEIRTATPEDADAAIPLIYSSGPAAFDYVFSHRTRISAKEFLHRVFQEPGGEFGFRNHVAVVCDGEVVGTGAAFSGEAALSYTLAMLKGIFRHYGALGAFPVMRRGLQLESIVRPPKGRLHYIAHLGVSPDRRSHGIGTRLVEHLLNEGRRLGRETAALDVSVENPRAEALYERLGFRTTVEIPSNLENQTARVPGHRRMELSL